MFEVPSPTHGYMPVMVAFWVYVLCVLAITVGVRAIGAPDSVVLVAFLAAAGVLLKAFVPVFRRLTPSAPGNEAGQAKADSSRPGDSRR